MNELDALRLMVKNFRGGIEVMAVRLGKSVDTLRKELAGAAGYKLGLTTATLISDMCIESDSDHCRAFVNVVAASGGGFVRLPVNDTPEQLCVQKSMSAVVREMSDVTVSTLEGDADDCISDNDLKRAVREISEAHEALQKLERALIDKNARGKAAREAA